MDFLNAYPWQAWVHLTAEPNVNFDRFDKCVGAFRGKLASSSNLQVSSWGVFSRYNGAHGHVLLLGKNKFGKTLADVSQETIDDMVKFWSSMMHRSNAQFELLHNAEGAVGYVINNNTIEKTSAQFLTPRGLNC